jgi:putative SOS response-associated peptidase YedK
MCNLYSITTNQAAIITLFRVMNRYVGNLPAMPGVFPDYPAPVVRNAGADRELTATARRRIPGHEHTEHVITALAGLAEAGKPLPSAVLVVG